MSRLTEFHRQQIRTPAASRPRVQAQPPPPRTLLPHLCEAAPSLSAAFRAARQGAEPCNSEQSDACRYGWLEVEEGRESSSWEEKEVKSKSQPPLGKGPLLSLLSDKGSRLHQCGGSSQERERERA
jgi:hypothetical protein